MLWDWNWEPWIVLPLALSAWLYGRGALAMRRNAGGRRLVSWQVAAFGLGWLSLVVALVSPLDALAEQLFSAHMAQHEILMAVAPPLLVLGRPLIVMLWGLPTAWREPAARLPRATGVERLWHLATGAVAVWALHGLALWCWHLPALYQAAVENEAVHAAEHLCLFGTAALFWWALVHGRYGRLGYGLSVLFVFTTAMHSGLLGALLTIAPRPWYPVYGTSVIKWGLTPLEDQQLAGLLMWIPAGAVFVTLALALFAAWIRESERRVVHTSSERLWRGARGGSGERA